MPKKVTIEKLAEMTARGFTDTENRLGVKIDAKIDALNEKMDMRFADVETEFAAVRSEMKEGFRTVLAAIESVEYVKLRMRIDSLETRMGKVERPGKR